MDECGLVSAFKLVAAGSTGFYEWREFVQPFPPAIQGIALLDLRNRNFELIQRHCGIACLFCGSVDLGLQLFRRMAVCLFSRLQRGDLLVDRQNSAGAAALPTSELEGLAGAERQGRLEQLALAIPLHRMPPTAGSK